MSKCYVDVAVRFYDAPTIAKLNFLRQNGTNLTKLIQNAILMHDTGIKETKKKL